MQDIEFLALDGQVLSLNANAEFVESSRQHALGEGAPAAYVASVSDVFDRLVDTDERCIVVVLPELASEAIDYSATHITAQVRTRPDGTPIACGLFGKGRMALNADALNAAQPLNSGRLTILWLFKDTVALCHFPYSDDTDEELWLASSVADGHRHEKDYDANANVDANAEAGMIEVLNCFTCVEAAG